MKCQNCGSDNPQHSKFCNQCGKKLGLIFSRTGPDRSPEGPALNDYERYPEESAASPDVIDYTLPQSYTPKFLADKILTTRSSIEGERKHVTILFADVAGSTAIFENLDPEEVHEIMDGCFRILMNEIHRYEGTINQFRGDGVMALFGAPLAHEDHAQRACHASLAMQEALKYYAGKMKEEYDIDLLMRIGLHTGHVVVGAIGDDLRMDYTAQGDTANLASRMESIATPGTIYTSHYTYKLAKDFFEFEPLGDKTVKGKKQPVRVYKLLNVGRVDTRLAAAATKGLANFVGRMEEMESLHQAYNAVRSGLGQSVAIVGEAGVGKSRLLLEFRKSIPDSEYTFLEGNCIHYGANVPYLPILKILRAYLEIKDGDDEWFMRGRIREKILSLNKNLELSIAPIEDLLSLKVMDAKYWELEPARKRERIFGAIWDLLKSVSGEKPLICALDSLQWVDKTTDELLDYLVERIPGSRILLLLLFRPEYRKPLVSGFPCAEIRVDRLSEAAGVQLMSSIFDDAQPSSDLEKIILDRSSGNPLFIEELIQDLMENGSIIKRNSRHVLRTNIAKIEIPDTIQGVISARIDRLNDDLKRILQIASVIGREFSFRILQAATGMKQDLESRLRHLEDLEYIFRKKEFPESEYIFKHALIQEIAYKSLLLRRRKQIHNKIGDTIEELFQDRLGEFYEILAYHYSKSENLHKAYRYLILSADKITRNNSLWEGLRYFKKALEVLSILSQHEELDRRKIEELFLMSMPSDVVLNPDTTFEILKHGEQLADEIDNPKASAVLYSLIGVYQTLQGSPAVGRQYQERSFRTAEKLGDPELLVPVGFDICVCGLTNGDFVTILGVAPKVLTNLEKTRKKHEFFGRPVNPYATLCGLLGISLGMCGNRAEALDFLEKSLVYSHEIDHVFTIGISEFHYAYMLLTYGDGRNAITHLQRAIESFNKIGALTWLSQSRSMLGFGYHLVGQHDVALENIRKGLTGQQRMGTGGWRSIHEYFLGMVEFDVGRLEEARSHADKAMKIAHSYHEKELEGRSSILLGGIVGKMDRAELENAEKLIVYGIQLVERLELKPIIAWGNLTLGDLYADWGREGDAVKLWTNAENVFHDLSMNYWLKRSRRSLARL